MWGCSSRPHVFPDHAAPARLVQMIRRNRPVHRPSRQPTSLLPALYGLVLVDVTGCYRCDLLTGRRELPGGVLHETSAWVVNHVVGPMNLGTLIVGPQDHIVAVADPDDTAAAELGPLARADLRLHVVARPRRA